MRQTLSSWITKAQLQSNPDLGTNAASTTAGGLLAPDQAKAFLMVAINYSVLMREARVETSNATKFEIPRLDFASRILKVGTEATRLVSGDRVKPTSGLVQLSTYLFRGEVPVSDEYFEDNIEGEGVADSIAQQIAEAIARDVEEIAIKSDDSRTGGESTAEPEFDITGFNGLVNKWKAMTAAQVIDATNYTTFDDLFADMFEKMPTKYRRTMNEFRIYTSTLLRDRYIESLAQRGTPLGDAALSEELGVRYRGVPVVEVPMLSGTSTINSVSHAYDQMAVLTHPKNIIFGFHRKIKLEKFRDPRDGATSFLPSVRFDAQLADPNHGVFAWKASGL